MHEPGAGGASLLRGAASCQRDLRGAQAARLLTRTSPGSCRMLITSPMTRTEYWAAGVRCIMPLRCLCSIAHA